MDEKSQTVTFYSVNIDLTPRTELAVKPDPEMIRRLQDALSGMSQIELEPEHYFAPGMYGRKLAIPADSVIVGKTHRHAHLILLTKGEATVLTDEGMQRLKAPQMWVSSAGTKRALYTHEDSEFVTVHVNSYDERDLSLIEADVIEPDAQIGLDHKAISEFTDELQEMYA